MAWKTLIEEMDVNDTPFFNDALLHLDTQTIEVGNTRTDSVDLSRVVGTTHPDYHGKSWEQLKPIKGTSKGDFINNIDVAFQPLKKAVGNIQDLERNPDYYFSNDKKDHWSFYEIKNNYYASSGNNRTIISRFFLHLNEQNPLIHGVEITSASYKIEPIVEIKTENLLLKVLAWLKT